MLESNWLIKFGMSEYVDHFVKNRIDIGVLTDLTEHDLEKPGVFHGDRRKMLRAIRALASNTPPAVTQARRHDAAQC